MRSIDQALVPFRRRLRLLLAWKGLAVGTVFGAFVGIIWVVLDWTRVAYTSWQDLGFIFGGSASLGLLTGLLWKLRPDAIARSVDRRAGLRDRVVTAVGTVDQDGGFAEAQRFDATSQLSGLKASEVFKLRTGRWQGVAVASIAVVAGLFMLGNSPVVRGPKDSAERAELAKAGEVVQRVAKPLAAPKAGGAPATGDRKLAAELTRFGKELREARIDKQESMRKANEMAAKAEIQSKARGAEARNELEEAETALAKLEHMKLEEEGIDLKALGAMEMSAEQERFVEQMRREQGWKNESSSADRSRMEASGMSASARELASLSPEQRAQLKAAIVQRQADIQKQIDAADALPAAERKALESQARELQKLQESLKLSEEAVKALQDFAKSAEAQELRELMQKMAETAAKQSEGQKVDPEQLKAMSKQLEELAKAVQDPAMREAVMKNLREALSQMEQGAVSQEAAAKMMAALGMMQGGMDGENGGEGNSADGGTFMDTGKVNTSKHPLETSGKTRKTGVKGAWDDDQGKQYSIDIKAPTEVGKRSSVPYQKLLPRYKRAAERAIERSEIPRAHEKRVKEYFDSLGK